MSLFEKRLPGKLFPFDASDHNAMLDAALMVRRGERPFPELPIEPRNVSLCLVRNDSGADRDQFAVLGLNGPIITAADDLAEFKSLVTFKGITPVAGTHEGKYCVLLEPLASGKIGSAAIAGVVPVRLTGTQQDWAEIANGVTTLASGSSGSARVLYQESGTSQRWALVRIAEKVATSSTTFSGARLANSATTSAAQFSTVDYDLSGSALFDTASYLDTTNNRFNISSDGYYHVGFSSINLAGTLDGYAFAQVLDSVSQIICSVTHWVPNGWDAHLAASGIFKVTSGSPSWVKIQVRHSKAETINFIGGIIWIYKVG